MRRIPGWPIDPTHSSPRPMMVGGMMPISEEARAMGARPAWNGYVLVDDVDVLLQSASKPAGGAIHPRPRGYFPASAASVSPPTRTGRCSTSLKQQATRNARRQRQGRQAMSAGMNCTQAMGQAPSPSIPACLVGPKPKPWIWGRWASIRFLRRAVRRAAA